ncbi:heme ABC transporter ATP-binding protein [Herbiconiux sp.]|uniref:heme ABC transporter ATP-binding protein n=1 Tax=Herbiconiux sp. TaxID=1871186 RepID=UPI0025BF9B79|nr:heme ABC transporter ATP-binding protein [Herbiconiux sp.]
MRRAGLFGRRGAGAPDAGTPRRASGAAAGDLAGDAHGAPSRAAHGPRFGGTADITSGKGPRGGPGSQGAGSIDVDGVSVTIDGTGILHDVSLQAHPGMLLALVGPNGAGKSTLLTVIAGDQAVDSGTVRVAGHPLASWSIKQLARERSVLLQQTSVAFPFTVTQVVEMGRAPWIGTPFEADDEAAVAEALDLTDLHSLTERHVPSLSGGERARAALARVLAQRTRILLLDEPTAALDIGHQEDVLRIARAQADLGDTVVVVLHDLGLAAAFADRVCLLENGRVVADGTPTEVFDAELLSAVYRHPLEVLTHPVNGTLLILPVRSARGPSSEENP